MTTAILEAQPETIDDISMSLLPYYQHRALMRLQLTLNAITHELLTDYMNDLSKVIIKAERDDGVLDTNDIPVVITQNNELWGAMFDQYEAMFEEGRIQATNIALAYFGKNHQRYIYQNPSAITESFSETALTEQANPTGAFEALSSDRDRILEAFAQRVYPDGINLSQRIWRLNQSGRQGIEDQLRFLITAEEPAINVISGLEGYLGANGDCPRWTNQRLNELIPAERLVSNTGLLSGNPCESKGFAYNAVRLVRNEIQIVYQGMFDTSMQRIPWIDEEQIILSPLHPPIGCICEDVVVGGRDGKGIYPTGQITLPLHVMCMCLKRPILPDYDEFSERLGQWVGLETSDPDLNQYTSYLNQTRDGLIDLSLLALGAGLFFWLYEDSEELLDLEY